MGMIDYVVLLGLAIIVTGICVWLVRRKKQGKSGCSGCRGCRDDKKDSSTLKFISGVALITDDVRKLAEFYQKVLKVQTDVNDIHVVIPVDGGDITIYSKAAAEKDMGFDFSKYHGTGLVKFSFSVDDVDAEYERLTSLDVNIEFITAPTTYPWGARSLHFWDGDGNIVCFVGR